VLFDPHASIVASDEVLAVAQFLFAHHPRCPMHDVGLIERPLVDVNDASLDSNTLTRQTNDAFDEQHARPGQPDGDDVAAPRFAANIGKPVDEVEPSV
jgi:hypothetical protein